MEKFLLFANNGDPKTWIVCLIGVGVVFLGLAALIGIIELMNRVCDKLAKINIPSTVTDIGEKAFERCASLKGLSLPEGIREIKAHTFMGCTSLVSFTVPESVEIIGASAFLGCTSLESITLPDALKEIGESAFHLSGIRSASIGTGVSTIGMMAFMQCENLTDVYYRGTLAELKSITTNGGWIDGKETVHCSDTDISASDLYN